MIRSSKYSLKFLTKSKRKQLDELFTMYLKYLQLTIDMMWDNKIPIKKHISCKQITWMNNLGGQYKNIVYNQASAIVRGCKAKKGKKNKPVVNNLVITLTANMVTIEESNNSFDKWVRIRLPIIAEGYKEKRIQLLIPIKEHKHSLKYMGWKQASTVNLSKDYIQFVYRKEAKPIKETGRTIGIDTGYKKLLVTSDNKFIGKDFSKLYEKIARKKQGSNAFKKALKERDNKINEVINKELSLRGIREIVIEDLKNVKHKSKIRQRKSSKFKTELVRKKFNNKLQRWAYPKVISKLERFSEENRILLTKINPAYTSQKCSSCGVICKSNRQGEKYKCTCGNTMDADYNASINISHMGVYSPHALY